MNFNIPSAAQGHLRMKGERERDESGETERERERDERGETQRDERGETERTRTLYFTRIVV